MNLDGDLNLGGDMDEVQRGLNHKTDEDLKKVGRKTSDIERDEFEAKQVPNPLNYEPVDPWFARK